MIAIRSSVDALTAQWRSQIMTRRNRQSIADRQGLATATILDHSSSGSTLIEIEKLVFVLLYEDEFQCTAIAPRSRTPLRLAAYGARRVPHGVHWGGVENSRLFKDLTLLPKSRAFGQRIERREVKLISLAL